MSDRDTARSANADNSSVYNDLAIRNMDIGDMLHKIGNYNLAIDSYTQALQCSSLGNDRNSLEKKVGLFLQKRATSRIKIGKYPEALEDALEKIRIHSKDIVGHIFASICYMYIEDADSSNESFLKSSIYIAQQSVVAEKIKLALQSQSYDYSQLLGYCDEFLEFSPFNECVQLAKKSLLALATENALGINTDPTKFDTIKKLPSSMDNSLLELRNNFEIGKRLATFFEANIALRKRDDEKALALFSKLIEAVAVRDYYMGRSVTLKQMGRLEEALNDCKTASMLRGHQDWAVCKLRGQILMEMKQYKEAVEQFESLILQMNNDENVKFLTDAKESLLQSSNMEKKVVQQKIPIDEAADIQKPEPEKPAPKKRIKLEPNLDRLQSLRSFHKKTWPTC